MTKDYVLNYLHVQINSEDRLMVTMDTKEFGKLESRTIKATKNKAINNSLLDSLADELIDRYEDKLANRDDS